MNSFIINLTNKDVTLTCYLPDYSQEMPHMDKRPAMLILPGGAYKFCSDREAEPIAFDFLAKGYAAFILRYSLNENAAFPNPLNDGQEAIKIIRENSENWHINQDKIAAVGFSAGGHLCAALATMADEKPNAAILIYPCILEDISHLLPFEIPDVSKHVDNKTVPCFIASSREDGCVPIKHSLSFADKLEEYDIPFEMHIFSTGYHGFSDGTNTVYSKQNDFEYNKHTSVWVDLCSVWLNKTFKD